MAHWEAELTEFWHVTKTGNDPDCCPEKEVGLQWPGNGSNTTNFQPVEVIFIQSARSYSPTERPALMVSAKPHLLQMSWVQ